MTLPLSPSRRFRLGSSLACLPLVAAVHAAPNPDTAVTFAPCTIGDERARVSAECATIDVALEPGTEGAPGATLGLAVARIRARREVPDSAPFTLIAGGPGQSAIDSWPGVAFAFRHIARDRDVILVDQRGTGASSPLECPADETPRPGGLDAAPDTAPAEMRRRANACLERLDADPRLFTTSVAVGDLDAVRERLGIERWNLYGVSYGTRVAQHYARRYPERVRTLILDAVVPADVPLGPDIAPFADRALELVFARCASSPECGARFPDLGARLRDWFAALERAPLDVEHEDLTSGEPRVTRFGARHLAALLRLMSYSARTAALLPSMLDAAIADGHVAPLARQSELQSEALEKSLASGMHHAIVCTEDAPRASAEDAAAATGTYLGTALLESLLASCSDWPAGVLDEDFARPLASDLPTLILSGEADPITPPVYGERVAATLSDAHHLINAGQGHMQAPLGCVPVLMAQFVASADPHGLDSGCLERLAPPPFFVDANGPAP